VIHSIPAVLLIAVLAFTLSSSAGLGGSLILVPGLALMFGAKEAVALAALLLSANNVAKVVAYRRSIPFRALGVVLVPSMAGALLGASFLLAAPTVLVHAGIIVSVATSFVMERLDLHWARRVAAPLYALLAGLTSGFSGVSGPFKGLALRSLELDRRHFVGAASCVSLAGDLTKLAVYAKASLLHSDSLPVFLTALPLMIAATVVGRHVNAAVGERGFAVVLWTVIVAYAATIMRPS
jgi:uncharacterized protein